MLGVISQKDEPDISTNHQNPKSMLYHTSQLQSLEVDYSFQDLVTCHLTRNVSVVLASTIPLAHIQSSLLCHIPHDRVLHRVFAREAFRESCLAKANLIDLSWLIYSKSAETFSVSYVHAGILPFQDELGSPVDALPHPWRKQQQYAALKDPPSRPHQTLQVS